jgi:hypothetical protein
MTEALAAGAALGIGVVLSEDLLPVVFLDVVNNDNRSANQMGHFAGTTFVVVGLSVSPLIAAIILDIAFRWREETSDNQQARQASEKLSRYK